MTAILDLPFKPLNLLGEAYVDARTFLPNPHVLLTGAFDRLLMLHFTTHIPIPNRKTPYRNHYALYVHKSLPIFLLVWVETTLDFGKSNDAELKYYNVTCQTSDSDNNILPLANKIQQWTASYDTVSVSFDPPDKFDDYILYSNGEWWFFDRGFILNGIRKGNEYTLDYLEFHTTQPPPNTNPFLVQPSSFQPFINNTSISSSPNTILTTNTKQTKKKIQSCFPSIYWFTSRALELTNNNITFFEPTSLC